MKYAEKVKLCRAIIGDYCREHDKKESELNREDIYAQSTVGIAMQFLGRTETFTEEDVEYLGTRGGVMKTYVDNNIQAYTLTLTDILSD